MSQQDDDATLTQLAAAHVGMHEGGEKCQEALNTFQDLGEKYNMSLLLINGLALCHMHLSQFDEAERLLQEGLTKNATGTIMPCLHSFSPCLHLLFEYSVLFLLQM